MSLYFRKCSLPTSDATKYHSQYRYDCEKHYQALSLFSQSMLKTHGTLRSTHYRIRWRIRVIRHFVNRAMIERACFWPEQIWVWSPVSVGIFEYVTSCSLRWWWKLLIRQIRNVIFIWTGSIKTFSRSTYFSRSLLPQSLCLLHVVTRKHVWQGCIHALKLWMGRSPPSFPLTLSPFPIPLKWPSPLSELALRLAFFYVLFVNDGNNTLS